MDVSDPKPRVNFELLQQYIGRKVLLVGQVQSIEGLTLKLQAADGGMVTVHIKPGSTFDTAYAEIEGIVDSPNTVTELDHADFGTLFDLATYNELCKLSNNEYKSMYL